MLLKFFPNIPEGACSEILEHGFQKGSGRVGRSRTLEDKLKVQLAVNAHIRHRLTQYDSLLAANKGQDVKLTARGMVYGQVQAIAEIWRGSNSRTSAPKNPAATLKANRQRRIRESEARRTTANKAQLLEEAFSGLRLSENEHEAAARTEAAQQREKKKAEKVARRAGSGSKKKRRVDLRRHGERKGRPRKGVFPQDMHERQDRNPIESTKGKGNRRLRITANGVGLEPKEIDRYVPVYRPENDQPPKPRLMRRDYPIFDNTTTESDTPSDRVELKPKRYNSYVPTSGPIPSIDPPRKSRYPLRNSHDRYLSASTPSLSIRSTRNSRYPLRSSYRTTGDVDTNGKGLDAAEQSTSADRLMVEDAEWMDIDDMSLRTAGVHLALL